MITVIVGTNAHDSATKIIADIYIDKLKSLGVKHQLLQLKDMPTDILASDMYFNRKPSFVAFSEKYLEPTEKYIIVIPEYNGGIPGIFKLMMDASDIAKCWWGKKACLTGVAAGRSGNLRGLDTLTNYLNYLKVDVLKNKIPISRVHTLIEDGQLIDKDTIDILHVQLDDFLSF